MGGKIVVWPAASLWPVASLLVAELLAVGLLAGCGASGDGQRTEAVKPPTVAGAPKADDAKGTPGREAHKAPAESESSDEPKPLVLTPEEREKLGITTAPAQAITFTDSSTAFGVVLSHDSIAQAVADLETAAGAAHLSEIALTRAQKLATGPGALGVDTLETLQKQKSADQAAFSLARRKITAVVGVRFPWQGAESDAGVLNALASGDAKLVRATFASGAFAGAAPKSLRIIPLEPGAAASVDSNADLTATPVWTPHKTPTSQAAASSPYFEKPTSRKAPASRSCRIARERRYRRTRPRNRRRHYQWPVLVLPRKEARHLRPRIHRHR